jgi:outer membrane protein OmpA-like peptidoglycan-associated protein
MSAFFSQFWPLTQGFALSATGIGIAAGVGHNLRVPRRRGLQGNEMTRQTPSSTLPMRTPEAAPVAAASRYPFVPYGLVPLTGLIALIVVALVPFAFGEVQAATQASARAALDAQGFDWVRATASGQWVVLEGRPPSREAAREAENAVRRAQADTLFGQAAPATWVISQFTWTEDPLDPSDILRPRSPTADDPGVAPPPATAEQAAACDTAMAGILSTARIEFSTASAAIDGGSTVLDVVAAAARNCQGVLRIEGHTDAVGRDDRNSSLSLRRAEAVRAALIARGVPASRLVAEGFGDSRPLASNDTADGRARNRRIEIRSVRPPPT